MVALVTLILLQLTPIDYFYHEINSSNEVLGVNETEYWGTVNFDPIPSFRINTRDPLSQDEYISTSVYNGSKPWLWDKIISVTPENMTQNELTFVDIGAGIGYFSLAAVSMGYNVITYEHASSNVKKIADSIEANNFSSRIHLYQNAMSVVSGEQLLLRDTEESKNVQGWFYGLNYITSISLSDMMKGRDVHIVKINVDEYEGNVLVGAKEWICNHVIKNIIIDISESTKVKIFPSYLKFEEFMRLSGYDVVYSPKESLTPIVLFTLKEERAICQNV